MSARQHLRVCWRVDGIRLFCWSTFDITSFFFAPLRHLASFLVLDRCSMKIACPARLQVGKVGTLKAVISDH